MNSEEEALARALNEHGVPVEAKIYLVVGRPDATIEFYSRYRIQRLINEMEMAAIRPDRRSQTPELYREFSRRIEQKLGEIEPVYLILSAGHYGMLQRNSTIRSRVLFELNGFHDEAGDEQVVITQPDRGLGAAASRPAT